MASKRTTELQALSKEQLLHNVAEMESNISKLKFDHAIRGLQNPLEIRNTRKEIARLNTEIRNRDLAEATPEVLAKRSKLRLRRRLK